MASHQLSIIFCLHLVLFALLNTHPVAGYVRLEHETPRGRVKVGKSNYDSFRDEFVSKLKPGDHIAAARRDGIHYEHHGIYEGMPNGYPSVIHFQRPKSTLLGKGSASPSCNCNCGYQPPKKGGRVVSCIDCFSKRKKMYKMQYMLQKDLLTDKDLFRDDLKPGNVIAGYRSKKYYLEHFKDGELYGHSEVSEKICSVQPFEDRVKFYKMYTNRSSEQVLEAAKEKHKEFRPYNLACNNCEHFAVFCKTGNNKCHQIERLKMQIFCKKGKTIHRSGGKSTSKVMDEYTYLNNEEIRFSAKYISN